MKKNGMVLVAVFALVLAALSVTGCGAGNIEGKEWAYNFGGEEIILKFNGGNYKMGELEGKYVVKGKDIVFTPNGWFSEDFEGKIKGSKIEVKDGGVTMIFKRK